MRIQRGDTVLIRTGWGKLFTSDPTTTRATAPPASALSGAQVPGQRSRRAVVGNDTLTFEVRPPLAFPPEVPQFQVFPVHMLLIPDNGINIIENYFLEEIAAAKEYEFLLVVPPIKIRGGTGSALRSFAMVPRS